MSAVARKKLTLVDGGGKPPAGGSGGFDPDAWKSKLVVNRDGRIEGSLHNVQLILEHDERVAGIFWLDEFANQILLSRDPPWTGGNRDEFTDQDACELASWLQHPDQYKMAVNEKIAVAAVGIVARRHRRHPPREFLRSLRWDGTPRVERVLCEIFGAEDRAYTRGASKCWLVSAVARILHFDPAMPSVGAQVDFMLVLEGGQGKKKTSTVRALFGAPWYVETHESPSHKDFYQVIRGAWCVEIAELESFRGAEVNAVKAAVTRRVDKYRAPYERVPRSWRRECVFVGTTNQSEYLRDASGGRRFLPVTSMQEAVIDYERALADREQIWAEAVAMLDGGFEFWRLPDEVTEEQDKRYIEDSWEGLIRRWLLGKDARENAYPSSLTYGFAVASVSTADVMAWALRVEHAKQTKADQLRVADVFKRLGWHSVQRVWETRMPKERRWAPISETWAQDQLGSSTGASASEDSNAPPF